MLINVMLIEIKHYFSQSTLVASSLVSSDQFVTVTDLRILIEFKTSFPMPRGSVKSSDVIVRSLVISFLEVCGIISKTAKRIFLFFCTIVEIGGIRH